MIITFDNFVDSFGCGPFTYTLAMTAIPSFISIDSSTNEIIVNTASVSDVGTYQIIVKGELFDGVSQTTSFKLFV